MPTTPVRKTSNRSLWLLRGQATSCGSLVVESKEIQRNAFRVCIPHLGVRMVIQLPILNLTDCCTIVQPDPVPDPVLLWPRNITQNEYHAHKAKASIQIRKISTATLYPFRLTLFLKVTTPESSENAIRTLTHVNNNTGSYWYAVRSVRHVCCHLLHANESLCSTLVLDASISKSAFMPDVVFGRCFAQIGSWHGGRHIQATKDPVASYDLVHRLRPSPHRGWLFANFRAVILASLPLFALPSRRVRGR